MPGENPVCLIGAGFSLAVLKTPPPSTTDLIRQTLRDHAAKFPILNCLVRNGAPETVDSRFSLHMSLNSVWRRSGEFAQFLAPHFREMVGDYSQQAGDSRIRNAARRLLCRFGPIGFIKFMLEIELKRMVALQYEGSTLHGKPLEQLPGLRALIEDESPSTTTWISLNYDTALEVLLQGATEPPNWRYCFEQWLTRSAATRGARHVLAKPHGSVKVWFDSLWREPPRHLVYFADAEDHLRTCSEAEVGCDDFRQGDAPREYRPWLIGYLPDEMKDEINTPGYYADAAHDLCKGNLAVAALSLQKATSLYVLGYSMPPEDTWVWRRVVRVLDESVPVYVASARDTQSICNHFRASGFTNVQRLTESGNI